MAVTETAYIPGICNINRAEIASRRKVGHIGLALFIVVLLPLVLINCSRYYRVILFLPAFISTIGYLQARSKFCVSYAGSGQQNAAEGSSKASVIADKQAVKADKHRAQRMYGQALIISVVITLLAIVTPHI